MHFFNIYIYIYIYGGFRKVPPPRALIHTPHVAGYGTGMEQIWGIAGCGTSMEQVWSRYGTGMEQVWNRWNAKCDPYPPTNLDPYPP